MLRIALVLVLVLLAVPADAQVRYKDADGVWHWVDSLDQVPPAYRPGAVGRPTPTPAPSSSGSSEAEQRSRDFWWSSAVKRCTATAQGASNREFKAFVPGPGQVEMVGSPDQQFAFRQCMAEAGQTLK